MSDVKNYIENHRKDFEKGTLTKENIVKHPFDFFKQWLDDAIDQKVREPYAFHLATSVDGIPQNRVLYLRGLKDTGYIFYTNYDGNKGKELAQNPNVSMNFFWAELERQVRITGTAQKVDEKTSDEYFASRPRKSQLGAWASRQSRELEDYSLLEERLEAFDKKFKDNVPRPPHWGGYIVTPKSFEFWQGRPSRLHDRFLYEQKNDEWVIKRLNP